MSPTFRAPRLALAAAIAGFGLLAAAPAVAEDVQVKITIRNFRFEPAEVTAPAGKRIKLTVENADKTAEEFESHDFSVEKIVGGGKTISVFVGPLKPGRYKFFGERHEDTAQGVLVVQ